MFFKKVKSSFFGKVERIGVVQEPSGDAGRTCYAVLIEGEPQARIIDTEETMEHDQRQALFEIRVRIALTAPGDDITVGMVNNKVVEFSNQTLGKRTVRK